MSTLIERLEVVAVVLEDYSCPGGAYTVREAARKLAQLEEDSDTLHAMRQCEVDNWEGMDEVANLIREWDADDAAST